MNKLECLRRLVANFGGGDLRSGPVSADFLDQFGLVKGTIAPGARIIGVKRAGLEALFALSELLHHEPTYERGCTFEELTERVFHAALDMFFERASEPLHNSDLAAFELSIADWMSEGSPDQRLFVACAISNARSEAFSIGPVHFQYIDDFIAGTDFSEVSYFDQLIADMRQGHALWMATVDVSGCLGNRACEIGDMAVDLALVGIQLVVPFKDSARMARLCGRRVPARTMRLAVAGEEAGISFKNQSAGLTLMEGTLAKCVNGNATIIGAVGSRVSAFLTGLSVTPELDRAWADGAYWFHEGLAEPLDSVAIPKLETAIEILLRAESASGSERRVLTGLRVFYGREPNELLNPDSVVTIGQFAKRIVQQRSRILHGTISTLHASTGASRDSLAELAAGILRTYTVRLDEYRSSGPISDELEAFLAWVIAQRP